MKLFFSILFLATFTTLSVGQDVQERGLESLGMEVQLYPAGTILNLKGDWAVSPKSMLIGKIGYNRAMRQDFGKHDSEEGGGLGFTAAYKRYLKAGFSGWFVEARAGMWFLDIDWRDDSPARFGNTDISVFQPTAGIGYDFKLNENLKLGLIAAFGYEVNVATKGDPVGEGGISLIGISFSHKLGSRRSPKAVNR